jgi:hypothetical protein
MLVIVATVAGVNASAQFAACTLDERYRHQDGILIHTFNPAENKTDSGIESKQVNFVNIVNMKMAEGIAGFCPDFREPINLSLVRCVGKNPVATLAHRYFGLSEGVFSTSAGTWSDFFVSTETALKLPLMSRV